MTPAETTPQMRLQMLTAEHSSLASSRALAWNEVFGRAGMFLSALSGAIVAIALVGQGTGFARPFPEFALAILPVVLFLGVTTFVRLGTSNYHDAQCVIGMNRIRAAYLELAPDLAPYFVMSAHDDPAGVGVTMGVPPGHQAFIHLLAATPSVIAVIDGVLAGAIAGLAMIELGLGGTAALLSATAVFVVSFAAHVLHGRRSIARSQARVSAQFPSPVQQEPHTPAS